MGYESLTMSKIIAQGSLCLTNFGSVLFGVVNGFLRVVRCSKGIERNRILFFVSQLQSSSSSSSSSKMGCDKQCSRDEHYVGGLLQVIDRSSKSRKRLFSSELDLPEQINQGMTDCKPIQKFQLENLLPRSAKSIHITQIKFLSPMNTPGSNPSENAACVAETVYPRPHAASRSEVLVAESPSVSLKVLQLKEKPEIARKQRQIQVDANAAKCIRERPSAKSLSSSAEERNANVKNKGTSISLAVQAKFNVQKRESLIPSNASLEGLKEPDDVGPSQSSSKTETHSLKSTKKKSSAHGDSAVLRPNNQKQNRSMDNEKSTSKASVSDSLGRKTTSACCGYSDGRHTGLCKDVGTSISSRKSISEARGHENEISNSEAENVPQKKQSEPSRHVGGRTTRPVFKQEEGMLLSSNDMQFSSLGDNVVGTDALRILLDQKLREYSSNSAAMSNTEECLAPSPVSVLGPSLLAENCSTSDTEASNNTQERKHHLSFHCGEVYDSSTAKDSISEAGTDLSDSATSSLLGNFPTSSTEWELDYIKDMLGNVELMFKDYTLGRTREVMNPHLFKLLERRRITRFKTYGYETKLERKLMFDCVKQCLDMRCQHLAGGSYNVWAKGVAMVSPKRRLAEEVHREIEGWRSMEDCVVDELVDGDMSSRYWHDFRVDLNMLGVEIERHICDSLIDEVVADAVRLRGRRYSFNSASVV
ncbi:hypothetical protein Droror1_Dr00015410 [Drosera rotundifolia]